MLVRAIILNNKDAVISVELFPKYGFNNNIKKFKKYAASDDSLQESNLNPNKLVFGHLIFFKKWKLFILKF